MGENGTSSNWRRVVGAGMLLVGVAVFLIRLQHAGPYGFPRGGNLTAGLLALAIGAWLVRDWTGENPITRIPTWIALGASPVVLFFALYATLAELEEVVVLKTVDRSGQPSDLRLWIVDDDAATWVTMPRAKADAHGLDDVEVDLLRGGNLACVQVTRIEDRARVLETHRLRMEKYAVQRLAAMLGVFGREPDASTVTLRLDPCVLE